MEVSISSPSPKRRRLQEQSAKDFNCLICLEIINNPIVIGCGHTFCLVCIQTGGRYSARCPDCDKTIKVLHCNHIISKLVSKLRAFQKSSKSPDPKKTSLKAFSEWHKLLIQKTDNLNLNEIDGLLGVLKDRKAKLVMLSNASKILLLKNLVGQIRHRKLNEYNKAVTVLGFIKEDLTRIDRHKYSTLNVKADEGSAPISTHSISDPSTSFSMDTQEHNQPESSTSVHGSGSKTTIESAGDQQIFSGLDVENFVHQLKERKKKMKVLIGKLEPYYIESRIKNITSLQEPTTPSNILNISQTNDSPSVDLDEFREILSKITMFTDLKLLGTFIYGMDPRKPVIASSIAFDKDNEIFAVGGNLREVKLFEYASVLANGNLLTAYPLHQLESNLNVTSISFSPYFKEKLACADSAGAITIWDASTRRRIATFREHLNRCWSVNFNKVDVNLLVSGSDDGSCKLWSLNTNDSRSIFTFNCSLHSNDTGNISSVQFNPTSAYEFAVGGASRDVYLYDLRYPDHPVATLVGHNAPVSCVQYLNSTEIVSLSIDGSSKLWKVGDVKCQRTFKGHFNKRNFVGLSSKGDFFSCGSEENAVYVYYKQFPRPIAAYNLGTDTAYTPLKIQTKRTTEYSVASVCWRPESNVILVGNSQGMVKKAIMECEKEWSMNKKLVEMKDKCISKSLPKGLSYFWVSFGPANDSYGHVIEDELDFSKNFAYEVISGLLDIDRFKYTKPKNESFDEQFVRVSKFKSGWKQNNPATEVGVTAGD